MSKYIQKNCRLRYGWRIITAVRELGAQQSVRLKIPRFATLEWYSGSTSLLPLVRTLLEIDSTARTMIVSDFPADCLLGACGKLVCALREHLFGRGTCHAPSYSRCDTLQELT